MRQLAIIIFLITSLYSHEANCLNMFAVVFDKNTTDENTAKDIEYYIDKIGCDANITLENDKLHYEPNLLDSTYAMNKPKTLDLLLQKGTFPSKWLTRDIATEFLVFFRENSDGIKDKKLIKKLLEHGQDPYHYGYLRVILKIVGDEKDLDKLLESEKR